MSRVTYTYSVNETDHEEVKYYDVTVSYPGLTADNALDVHDVDAPPHVNESVAVTVDTTTGKARLGTGKDDIVGGVGWYIFAGLILFLSRILQAWVGPGDEPETPVHPQ